MGQRWSMLKNGYLEESEFDSEGDSESVVQLQQSEATTEASSSVPASDRGLCSTCPNDIELSNLRSGEATVDARRGKVDARVTPTLSTSHLDSSLKGSLADSQAPCRLRPRKLAVKHKLEAYREALHGQFAIRKLPGANKAGAAVQSPSLMSRVAYLTPDMGVAKLTELAQNDVDEDEMLLSPLGPINCKLEGAQVGKRKLQVQSTVSQPPYSPAQTLLMAQLDRKRKRSAGIASLALDCTGCPATHGTLKARTPLERPSEGVVGEVVLDLGTGDAMVGRCVKKVVAGRRECCKGRVSCYNEAQRLYQIKYEDGREEALEWLDLEPHLIAGGREPTRPRYKTVDELVYTNPKRPSGRRVKRR